ncbi:hypothetical protein CWS20_03785 [Cytobacillus horneckiae]|uniref:Uncharacterized protein n=1 Tax=Cytobacillus horneckiae TaxID=549687 RepID=A0A2N0ZKS9_9BACI|nr:hypothetical protein [Cytobacillus horneckiae]PKG30124.1 hypothetical protein CWS20_03785 [Cytobacillus horneckiae]
MRQIVQLDEQTKQEVASLEKKCENLVDKLSVQYAEIENLVIELIRCKKGKSACNEDVYEGDYESFIEVGIENDDEYFPNDYIPIWKCKNELFQTVGYITDDSIENIEKKLHCILDDMLLDLGERGRN